MIRRRYPLAWFAIALSLGVLTAGILIWVVTGSDLRGDICRAVDRQNAALRQMLNDSIDGAAKQKAFTHKLIPDRRLWPTIDRQIDRQTARLIQRRDSLFPPQHC